MSGWLCLSGPPSSSWWWSWLVRGAGCEGSEEKLPPLGHLIAIILRGMASLPSPSRSPKTPLLADSNQTPTRKGVWGNKVPSLTKMTENRRECCYQWCPVNWSAGPFSISAFSLSAGFPESRRETLQEEDLWEGI